MLSKSNEKRVAIIGLDGVPWRLLEKLFKYDVMPFLESITNNSLRGVLKSTVPPVTPPAWTSIATGVNPGKHGVFDFVKITADYETRIVSSFDVKYPRLHEMLALMRWKAISINLPFTFPVLKMDNLMVVSDWIGPKIYFFPKKIAKIMKDYRFRPIRDLALNELCKEVEARIKGINKLINELDWDLLFVVFIEPDHIMHKHEILSVETEIDNYCYEIFAKIDEVIENAAKNSDLLVITSDHGFSEYQSRININSYLARLGMVVGAYESRVKGIMDLKSKQTMVQKTAEIKMPPFLYRIAAFKPLKKVAKKIYQLVTGKDLRAKLPLPDPTRSKAFMPTLESFGIYVKEESSVTPLLQKLKKLKGIKEVWERENLYHGPYTGLAPNIIFQPDFDNGFMIGSTRITPSIYSEEKLYWHHPDGIFVIHGKGVHAKWMWGVSVMDIVPTILHYIGLPLPTDTDGTPISNIDYPEKQVEYYDYLKHWNLIKQIQLKKSKLAI